MNFISKLFGKKADVQPVYKKIIERAVDIYFENYDNPDKIANEIEKLSDVEQDTLMLYLFIPHVFCRLFLPEIQYPDYYIVTNSAGKDKHVKFSDSAIFGEMLIVIKNNWGVYVNRDIRKILFHSSDFKAANQLLGQGSQLKNLKALPSRIFSN